MKVVSILCCLLLPISAFTHEALPKGCQPIQVAGESLVLKAKKTDLIFIQNLTSNDMWITHPVVEANASAGWTSRLESDNWTALVVNKKNFALNCIESKPGHEHQISCEGAIAVCRWKAPKIPADQKGTFWVSENLTLSALKAAVGARGFVLSRDS